MRRLWVARVVGLALALSGCVTSFSGSAPATQDPAVTSDDPPVHARTAQQARADGVGEVTSRESLGALLGLTNAATPLSSPCSSRASDATSPETRHGTSSRNVTPPRYRMQGIHPLIVLVQLRSLHG